MSHIATNWAFSQRGLKPSAKLVLLALADCHNPAKGCFPTQAFLADACEINRDTVNVQLNLLENRGLICRIQSVDPATKRQRSTRYKLAFDADFGDETASFSGRQTADNSVSENPTRAVTASENQAEPCRKNAVSRVGKPDTNLVKEPVKQPETRGAREVVAEDLFGEFWSIYPEPVEREAAERAWDGVLAAGEGDAADLIEAARQYARSKIVERGFAK